MNEVRGLRRASAQANASRRGAIKKALRGPARLLGTSLSSTQAVNREADSYQQKECGQRQIATLKLTIADDNPEYEKGECQGNRHELLLVTRV